MRLDALIDELALRLEHGSGTVTLTDLVEDSRQVTPGCAFLARVGTVADGRAFIDDAVQRGAAAIITDIAPPADLPEHVAWARAEAANVRLASTLAERFFGYPSRALRLVGVTGTNGKTTTATLIHHLLNAAGMPCGLIGTLGVSAPLPDAASHAHENVNDNSGAATVLDTSLTTPGPIDFSRILAVLRARGCRAAVTEVSSHALDQGRVAALRFHVGVFTNLTGDHLDYHGTMAAYAAAKARLFAQLNDTPGGGWAVVNADDAYAERMLESFEGSPAHVLRCTLAAESADDADAGEAPSCRADLLKLAADHSRARFEGPWGSVESTLPLVGRHNVANALQAVAAAHTVADLTHLLRHVLKQCPNVAGRLERVTIQDEPAPTGTAPAHPAVLVDYAHTHDALENVLLALRPLTTGKLHVVFGCGGDRDRDKRPKMAQVAARLADRLWITSDNPRTEDPQRIIDDIKTGLSMADGRFSIEPDRAGAIRRAIAASDVDDTVLIAGKGHEDYQILADRTIHFDDREQAAAALRQWHEERIASCRPSP